MALVALVAYSSTLQDGSKIVNETSILQPLLTLNGTDGSSINTTVYSPKPQVTGSLNAGTYPVSKVTTNYSDVVIFNTPVVEESVDLAISMLSKSTGNTLYLVLNSPGGSVIDGARLINYIKYSGKNIITVCDNLCASMAFQIFQVGKKRLMTDKAILMAHPASGGARGIIENMYELIKTIKLYVDRMDAETAKRSGLDYNAFKMMVFNNLWAETPEALKLGLADGVVYLNVVGGSFNAGNFQANDVMTGLKKSGKYRENMLQVRGYEFTLK